MSGRHFVVQTPAIAPLPRTGAEDADPYQRQDTTEAGGLRRSTDTQYAAQGFDSVQIAEATVNEFTNPRPGSITDYNVRGGSVVTFVTLAAEGLTPPPGFSPATQAIKVVLPAGGAGGTHGVEYAQAGTFTAATQYNVSAWIFSAQAFTIELQFSDHIDQGFIRNIATTPGDWVRMGLNGVLDAHTTRFFQLLDAGVPASETFYIVGILAEKKAYATPVCVGSLIGCQWTGVADASTSTRAAATVELDNSDGLLSATLGGIVASYRALKDSTDAGDGYLVEWRQDANNLLSVRYDQSNGRFALRSRVAGVDDEATAAISFSRGDDVFLYAGWTDGVLRLVARVSSGISGTTVDSGRVARAQGVPTITATKIAIGSDDAGALQPNANLDYLATLSRTLTDREIDDFRSLVRPPWAGQVTGAPVMTGCLRGEDES